MRIVLRSPEFASRLADKASKLLPGFKRHQVLRAVAALYGHESWESLVECCRPDAPAFPFDQDLDQDAYRERRIDQAVAVRNALGIALLYADQLAWTVSATSDFRREAMPWSAADISPMLHHEANLWCVTFLDEEHALAPNGFGIALLTNIYSQEDPPPSIWVLRPNDPIPSISPEITGNHLTYYNRGELIEIKPVPRNDMMLTRYRPRKDDVALYRNISEIATREEFQKFVDIHRDWYHVLVDILQVSKDNDLEQFGIEAREEIGEPWYWPLQPLNPETQRDLIADMRKYGDIDWQVHRDRERIASNQGGLIGHTFR